MEQPARKRECRKLDQVHPKADDTDAPQRWHQDWSNDKFMRTVQLKTQFPVKAESFVDDARSPACPVKQTEQLREKHCESEAGKNSMNKVIRQKVEEWQTMERPQPAKRRTRCGGEKRCSVEGKAAQPQTAVLLCPA